MPLREVLKAIAEPRTPRALPPPKAADIAAVKGQVAIAANELASSNVVPSPETEAKTQPAEPVTEPEPAARLTIPKR
jgi:hypothetical protein